MVKVGEKIIVPPLNWFLTNGWRKVGTELTFVSDYLNYGKQARAFVDDAFSLNDLSMRCPINPFDGYKSDLLYYYVNELTGWYPLAYFKIYHRPELEITLPEIKLDLKINKCHHKNVKHVRFNTFEYDYCCDCKEEISPKDELIWK